MYIKLINETDKSLRKGPVIKKNGIKWIIKGLFQIGILVLFIGGFFKIFFTLPPNLFIKIFFLINYTWCTVGINVNFMIPLISLIDQKIVKKKN